MTHFHANSIECADCGEIFSAEIADNLHISDSSDVRASILGASFHRFECEHCGRTTTVETTLAYSDFVRKHWFVVVPSRELGFHHEWQDFAEETFRATMTENCPDYVREVLAPNMTRRVIFGLASLREKLICFDARLDDRIVEGLKARTLQELGLPVTVQGHFFLSSIDLDSLHFEYGAGGAGGVLDLPVPWAVYDDAVADDTQAPWREFFQDQLIVDLRVAALSPTSPMWTEASP